MKLAAIGAATIGFGIAPALAICPLVLNPVCALKADGARAKFANACVAERRHAKVLHPGECEAPGKEPTMCSMIYKPVCAADPASGGGKTYSSLCTAEVANANLLHGGECAAPKKGE